LHLSTVLFAIAAADPQVIARKLRFTLRLSLLIGLPGMAVLGFGAHLALSAFGPGYARLATLPLCLLVIGYLPTIPKMLYIAVCRAVGRIPRAAAVMTGAAVMEVTASAVGGAYGGLKGLSFALLAVYCLEGLVTTPPVIRAAIGSGRHRRADSSAAAAGHRASVADGLETPRSHAENLPIRHVQRLSWHSPPPHVPSTRYGRTISTEGYRTHVAALASSELTPANEQEAGIAALLSLARGETL
jgi:hypothetical protein